MMLLMLRTARTVRQAGDGPERWAACLAAVEEALDTLLRGGFHFLRG